MEIIRSIIPILLSIIEMEKQKLPVISIQPKILEKQRIKLQNVYEVFNNIPILKGHKNYLWEALKGLALA